MAVFRRESDDQEQQFAWPPDSGEITSAMEAFANGSTLHLVRFESQASIEVDRSGCDCGNPRGKIGVKTLEGLSVQEGGVLGG